MDFSISNITNEDASGIEIISAEQEKLLDMLQEMNNLRSEDNITNDENLLDDKTKGKGNTCVVAKIAIKDKI